MLDIREIIGIYNKIKAPVLKGSILREDLFLKDIIFDFIRNIYLNENPGDFFPDSRTSIPDEYSPFTKKKLRDWKKTKKKLNDFLKLNKKHITIGKDNPKLVSKIAFSHLIESLYCLERFLDFKR